MTHGHMAMGQKLWLHFGVDEHPFASYFDVHQGYRVLTHSHMGLPFFWAGELAKWVVALLVSL